MTDTLIQKLQATGGKSDRTAYPDSWDVGWDAAIEEAIAIVHNHAPSEIPGNDPLDVVLKEPGECFPRTLRQHINAISRGNVMCSARDVWRILDALLPLVQREPKREVSPLWQPMKSAPKDIKILAYGHDIYEPSKKEVHTTFWNENRWANFTTHITPTHWMPIPTLIEVQD